MPGSCSEPEARRKRAERADDPDSYIDTYYIPERARWATIKRLVSDVGTGLNEALRAIERRNDEELHGVTSHIDFNFTVGNVSLGDRRLRDLIWHFSRYRLRNEDFEFPDMLGAAYEYLLKQFADQGGKKGGQSYTPRPVVRMMCRLVAPQPGESVYDPCAGSGGMLILAREYVDDHDRDGTAGRRLALAGQELNGTAWAMAKMNMLLHGIRDADLRNGDTLADPKHIDGGKLRLFDKIITNPPFSIGYDQAETRRHFGTRMRYGWTAGTGKKADLMFVQHMLAVLRPNGTAATVMPHGVLFRGGAERDIRVGMLRDDCIEAVIGLAPNLFYGTGIPACILILRSPDGRREHAGQVLFINADREFVAGPGAEPARLRACREDCQRLPTMAGDRRLFTHRSNSPAARPRSEPEYSPLGRQCAPTRAAGYPRPPARRRAEGRGSGG